MPATLFEAQTRQSANSCGISSKQRVQAAVPVQPASTAGNHVVHGFRQTRNMQVGTAKVKRKRPN
eukprot:2342633-Rhodomonas_salina.1